MSMCMNRRKKKPKVKHESKHMARLAAHSQNIKKGNVEYYEAYRCYHCHYWHIGRRGYATAQKREMRRNKAHEEAMIGKLIYALKCVIVKNPDLRRER